MENKAPVDDFEKVVRLESILHREEESAPEYTTDQQATHRAWLESNGDPELFKRTLSNYCVGPVEFEKAQQALTAYQEKLRTLPKEVIADTERHRAELFTILRTGSRDVKQQLWVKYVKQNADYFTGRQLSIKYPGDDAVQSAMNLFSLGGKPLKGAKVEQLSDFRFTQTADSAAASSETLSDYVRRRNREERER